LNGNAPFFYAFLAVFHTVAKPFFGWVCSVLSNLFAGSHESAQRAAMFYFFFGTCRKNNINPFEWLKDVLERIPAHKANKLFELLPQNWQQQPDNMEPH
jgi:hypothetical protein